MKPPPVRVLVVTKIFPNALEPHSSPFNRQQFGELGKLCEVEVLATIPWFPFSSLAGGRSRAALLHDVPPREVIADLEVAHPRVLYLPKIGDAVASPLYAASVLSSVLRRRRRIDLLLASWAYPDGAAAVLLGAALGIPVAIKLHGSDLNVLGDRAVVRRHLAWALPRAAAIVAVSRPLAERAIELGARRERTHVVANGIDADRFAPRDRKAAREALGLPTSGKILTFVGRLTREKGALDLLDAFARLQNRSDVTLVMVGEITAEARARAAPLGERVRLVGAQPHDRIPHYLTAADVFTLPSWNEGTPNVVLEALASGRRVVATAVGGVPDVIREESLGTLVPPRDPQALADALSASLDREYRPESVVEDARIRTWNESARELFHVLERVSAP